MKKLIALLLALAMVACLFVGCSKDEAEDTKAPETTTENNEENNDNTDSEDEPEVPVDTNWKVAMVTDYGDITDQSFNQTTYEAGKAWCEARGIDFTYYKPTGDTTAERVAMIDQAVADGSNVLLLPGYAFAGAIAETVEMYPDVYYIALDCSEYDLQTEYGTADDFSWVYPANLYSAVYQEELSGYMAGYAAVKLGYKHLGYLGGMAVPAVMRFGYGYVQGIDAAAAELGITDEITVEYVYGNQFYGDGDITAYMDAMYQEKGVEICFACGGGIFTSAAEAAAKVEGAKIIGVDVDQAAIIDALTSEGTTITSAMKGLAATVNTMLSELIENDNWAAYSGKVVTLGLVSEEPTENYVQLAGSTVYGEGFSEEDYQALVSKMFNGEIVVSSDTTVEPETTVTVNYLGNIK